MKPAPTLFDDLYRATFNYSTKRRAIGFVDHPDRLRQHLRDARKFVLDDQMSSFLVDLSSSAFLDDKKTKVRYRLVDQMRTLARLPHQLTWVEFSYACAQKRALELQLTDPSEGPNPPIRTERQGWLLNQHPKNETLFRVHIFENASSLGGLLTLPFAFAWHTDEAPSVWAEAAANANKLGWSQSEMCVGVVGYCNDRCGIAQPEYFDNWQRGDDNYREMFGEFLRGYSATLRRVWALLATVNDIPIEARSVVSARGFVARGSYHRFLDHKIITLRVPDSADLKKIARNIIAISRRRAHQVRGHWRKDHWRVGERIWVHEHQRGDASLGFVTHDYVVEHPQ